MLMCFIFFFFFKQKTAYEMRISDWSSDVCSSDLPASRVGERSLRPCRRKPPPPSCRRWRCRYGPRLKHAPLITHPADMAVRGRSGLFAPAPPYRTGQRPPSTRSEERRLGKEGVRTCRSRGAPSHQKKKKKK